MKLVSRQRQTEFGIDAASWLILLVLILAAAVKFVPVPAAASDLDLPAFYGSGSSTK